jgi:hypothetical protein
MLAYARLCGTRIAHTDSPATASAFSHMRWYFGSHSKMGMLRRNAPGPLVEAAIATGGLDVSSPPGEAAEPCSSGGWADATRATGAKCAVLRARRCRLAVNIFWGLTVVVVVTALTVAAMLFVRTRAPEGSYFSDGDRASGVFGVLATGFSVLLGFIIFLAFTSYDASRSGAEAEATIVAQQVQTAQFLPDGAAADLTGELICYARTVTGPEWDAVDAGTLANAINPWGAEMFRTISTLQPGTATEQSAYDRWMSQTADREQARTDRVHGAEGIIPAPLWLVLFVISAVIFAYMLFFADRSEGVVTQGMLMGSVTVVITLLLLLLVFFNNPHGGGVGRLQPTAMERTLDLIDAQLDVVGLDITPPCDQRGNKR